MTLAQVMEPERFPRLICSPMTPAAMLGVQGEWRAEAAIRLSEFDEPIAEFEVDVK